MFLGFRKIGSFPLPQVWTLFLVAVESDVNGMTEPICNSGRCEGLPADVCLFVCKLYGAARESMCIYIPAKHMHISGGGIALFMLATP